MSPIKYTLYYVIRLRMKLTYTCKDYERLHSLIPNDPLQSPS